MARVRGALVRQARNSASDGYLEELSPKVNTSSASNHRSLSVPWGLGTVAVAVLAAALLVVLVLGGVVFVLVAAGFAGRQTDDVRVLTIVATILYQIGFFAIALVSASRFRVGALALGFRRFSPVYAGVAIAFLVIGFIMQILYGLLLRGLGLGDLNPQRVDVLVGHDVGSLALALVAGAVVAPIAEETFFRGLVLPGLRRRLGVVGAVAGSSVLFALAHLVPQVFPPIFVLGILLSLLRIWSGSVWPSISLHAAFNATSLILVYVAGVSGDRGAT